jgi:hypothetical protein
MAVEKERAIQENELQNRIELAKREELLIGQQGQNERREAQEIVEAQFITLAEEVRVVRPCGQRLPSLRGTPSNSRGSGLGARERMPARNLRSS